MGEQVSKKPIGKGSRALLHVVVAALVASIVVPVKAAEPQKKQARVPTVVTTGPSTAVEPIRVLAVHLREGAPGHRVEIEASGPVLWTSYRDDQDRIVVELTNSLPADDLAREMPGSGAVNALEVVADPNGRRPITRLVVTPLGRIEHSMEADGNLLKLYLAPIEGAEDTESADAAPAITALPPLAHGTVAAEEAPMTEEMVVAEMPPAEPVEEPILEESLPPPALPRAEGRLASLDPQSALPMGTADEPVVAPPPAGVPASRLGGVRVLETGADTVIRIQGNGEFQYSYFSLENPNRFVVDLSGVVNESRSTAVAVSTSAVEQVRIAQFKPYPDPVSRIVFDLNQPGMPWIDSSSDGLVVRFSTARPQARMAEPQAEAPPVAPREPAALEPPALEPDVPTEQARVGDLTAERQGGGVDIEDSTAQDIQEEPRLADAGPGEQLEVVTEDDRTEARVEREPDMPRVEVEQVPPAPVRPREVPPARTARPTPPPQRPIERQAPAAPAVSGGNDVVTLGDGASRFVGEPIDMSVRDADVVEVLRMFAQISGLNVVIQPGISGTVTVELENVPWDQALDQILRINGLGFELEGNIMRVAPNSILEREAQERQRLEAARALAVPLRTILRRLSYASATSVAQLLTSRGGVLSQRGSVIVDERTNTLIIKELPEYMDTVIAVIQNLDTPEPQVMIEARIVETTKRFSRTLGIQWGFQGEASAELGNTTGLQFPNNVDTDGGVNLLTGGNNGFINLSLGNVLNSFNLDLALQAAENEGLINILSAPKIATLNNQSANIQSGLQIPVQTVANNTVTVQFINATLELQVTPQVTAEGTVLMDINIAKREPQLAFAVQGASNAPISTKEAATRVIVRDGGTTVIGGIYEVSTDQGQDRVPGLANIPILGHLFRNKRRNDENEELLIFITPRVINL
jgi:type IV pilus assembly protein PilQ